MQFLPSLPTYGQDQAAKVIWQTLQEILRDVDGICYYRHPVITAATRFVPDLTLLARGYEPLAIKYLDFNLDDLNQISKTMWTVYGQPIDSPLLETEDYVVG